MKSTAILLIASILLFSCKKEEIKDIPEENHPVFLAQGTLNGEAFSIIAGDNDAYMNCFTDIVHGVKKFSGNLSDGHSEIELGIFDGNIDVAIPLTPDQLANTVQWASHSNEPLAILSKYAFTNADKISSIEWYSAGIYIGTDVVNIMEAGKHTICGLVTFTDGSQSQLCNDLILGYAMNANFTLQSNLFPSGMIDAWIALESGNISAVEWKIDNQLQSETSSHLTASINAQKHQITAKVTFSNGVIRTKSFSIDGSLNGNNIQDFSLFEITQQNKMAPKQDFTTLLVVKKNNTEYRSDYADNSNSTLLVNDLTYFGLNASGKKVFVLSVAINCKLKNMTTNAVVEMEFETDFGIEIP
jgi:hypothetical protein